MHLKNKILYFLLMIIFLFTYCNKPDAWDGIKSSGQMIKQERFLNDFHTVVIKDNINVFLVQDTFNYIQIVAPTNLIDKISTEIENNKLIIANKNTYNWVRKLDVKINVYLTLKKIKYIDFRGCGNIESKDTICTDFFQADLNDASGLLKLKLKTQTSWFNIHTGCADINIEGSSGVNYIYSNGTGKVLCNNLKTGYTFINNNKTNDCYINVNYLLSAETNYLGNIYYTGNPQIIDIKEKGEGKVIKLP